MRRDSNLSEKPEAARGLWRLSVAIVGLALAASGCFESGPLALTTASQELDAADTAADPVEDVAATDTGTPDTPGTDAAPDAVPDTVADVAIDASDTLADVVPDATDVSDASDARDAEPDVSVRACLVDGDCTGVPVADRCAGTVRCIDYGCRPDPLTAVSCQEPIGGDPCVDFACNPASGLCEEIVTCSCAPDVTLGCGGALTWSTNDLGPVDHFAAYGCGPPAGSWVERLIGFTPPAGRVRLDLTSSGTAGMHLLELAGERCDAMTGCVGGATSRLYLDVAARPYVIAVDYAEGNSLVRLEATCGITVETQCDDGFDDEVDGLTDCDDRDCSGVGPCPFIAVSESGVCTNGIDDDQDGQSDCSDSDCSNNAGCLETCDILPINVGCGFHQGAPTGGGKAKATHYSCSAVPAPGREVVYRFRPSFDGQVNVDFASTNGIAVYLLVDTGRGCTPRDCVDWGTSGFSFMAVNGQTYYFAIDAPAGVEGNFDLHVTCE